MKKLQNYRVQDYLSDLSCKKPVPGGGSAAALTAAAGTALLSMVGHYSLGKGLPAKDERRMLSVIRKAEKIRLRLTELIDLDAKAYMQVVKTRQAKAKEKRRALRQAQKVPFEVSRLCYAAVELAPFLTEKGNKYLLSDVEVAAELLLAAFKSAMINVMINQS